jgi:hypothetical protein
MMMMCWWLVDSTTLAQHLVESNLELRLISPLRSSRELQGGVQVYSFILKKETSKIFPTRLTVSES